MNNPKFEQISVIQFLKPVFNNNLATTQSDQKSKELIQILMTNESNCFQLEYMTSAVVVVTLEVGETTPRGVILNFGGTLSITVL